MYLKTTETRLKKKQINKLVENISFRSPFIFFYFSFWSTCMNAVFVWCVFLIRILHSFMLVEPTIVRLVAWKQDYCKHRIYLSSIIWFCHERKNLQQQQLPQRRDNKINEHVCDRTVHGCIMQ